MKGLSIQTIEHARNGDRAALERLCRQFERPLFGFLYRLVGTREDALDLLQETWIDTIRGIESLRNPERLKSWLFGIAYRKAADFLQRRKRFVALDPAAEAAPDGDPDAVELKVTREAQLARAVDELPTHLQAVVVMHYLQDMGYEEIAQATGLPTGTVGSRLFYAKRELKRKMESGA